MGICQGPECDRECERRYCDAHWKQIQRTGKLTPLRPPLSPKEAVLEAGAAWLDADSEDDLAYKRAEQAFLARTEAWMRSRGWRPPSNHRQTARVLLIVQLSLPLRPPRGVHARAYARA